MRIGPREKQILLQLNGETFTPPSVFMVGGCGNRPMQRIFKSLAHVKKLAVTQVSTWAPEETLVKIGELPPGEATFERNAALRLTAAGVEVVARLKKSMPRLNMEWQPIDTAPKDGTKVIGYGLQADYAMTWHVMFWAGGGWWIDDPALKFVPTHWTELTKPAGAA